MLKKKKKKKEGVHIYHNSNALLMLVGDAGSQEAGKSLP